MSRSPIILAIDTSCDETSAAVTCGTKVLSNIVWSQANIHASFGGVVPSTARREHEIAINGIITRALGIAKIKEYQIDTIGITVGPGLAIALGVGIDTAKALSEKLKVPLIAINHLEGHILSPLAIPTGKTRVKNLPENIFPAYGLVISGGNTVFTQINKIGSYKILAETRDDALGEALDKGARLLGLGYPGGAILEKFAVHGNKQKYELPIPLSGQESSRFFSYSGLKTAFLKLVENEKAGEGGLTKEKVYDLAASYQNTAFNHLLRIIDYIIRNDYKKPLPYLLVGGGVSANLEIRDRLRHMCKVKRITPLFPFHPKFNGDNAGMIGVAAYFKFLKNEFTDPKKIDRLPNLKLGKNK
ncbi:MAG TPA: tRNA (adenosine(37)-N6)-threonylcarbamoyltransferase complex transferase subunit TsaD [Patescibacteria group bacterium]|nr:tRNA (adenosine(37)-N6)-threonylcarbamoyltransferase complex transferase subunit TsaD [Patescibacteria group bacterium]